MSETELTPYQILRSIDVSEHIEKKGKLNYLSWVWATDYIKMLYPKSYYIIHKTADGVPYWTDGMTAWVNVEYHLIDEDGKDWVEKEPAFPIMDYKSNSIILNKITSTHVNTAHKRAIVKCIAKHGLGFYIYAGEDLPFDAEKPEEEDTRISAQDVSTIQSLYTKEELTEMLKRLKKKNIAQLSQEEVKKMIDARSVFNDKTATF